MRKRILAASLIALAGNIGGAAAADVGVYTPTPEPPPYTPSQGFTWTGPYVGGMIGYGWGESKGGGHAAAADGVTGGAYAGYNFSMSNFLFGLEAVITASGMEGKNGPVRRQRSVGCDAAGAGRLHHRPEASSSTAPAVSLSAR